MSSIEQQTDNISEHWAAKETRFPHELVESKTKIKGEWILGQVDRHDSKYMVTTGRVNRQLFADKFAIKSVMCLQLLSGAPKWPKTNEPKCK